MAKNTEEKKDKLLDFNKKEDIAKFMAEKKERAKKLQLNKENKE